MKRWLCALVVLAGCGDPQLEGIYRVDEVTEDGCGLGDLWNDRVSLSLFGDDDNVRYGISAQEVQMHFAWVGQSMVCRGEGQEPVEVVCWPESWEEVGYPVLGASIQAREGLMELVHVEEDCTTSITASWRRRPEKSDGSVLIAPY